MNDVTVSSSSDYHVPKVHQTCCQCFGICHNLRKICKRWKYENISSNLLLIKFKLWSSCLLHGGGNTGNGVVVRPALETREHGQVDLGLHVQTLVVPPEEDDAGSGTSEGFVNGAGDNVAVLEGRGNHSRRHQTRHVSHVRHQPAPVLIGDLLEPLVVQVPGVAADAGNDHLGFEQASGLLQFVIVYQTSFGINFVRQGLEENTGGGDFRFRSVESMGEMTSIGKIKTHDTPMRLHQSCVHGKVGRRPAVWLDIDSPLCGIKTKQLQSSLLRQNFNLDNEINRIFGHNG